MDFTVVKGVSQGDFFARWNEEGDDVKRAGKMLRAYLASGDEKEAEANDAHILITRSVQKESHANATIPFDNKSLRTQRSAPSD